MSMCSTGIKTHILLKFEFKRGIINTRQHTAGYKEKSNDT